MPDHSEDGSRQTSYLRRGIGILAGGSPLFLLVASLVRSVTDGNQARTLAWVVLLVGLAIGGLNFYLSFLRGLRHDKRASGSLDGDKHVSGFPIIGSVLVVVGTVLGFGSACCAWLGVLVLVLDTGGSPWFIVATWRDASLWDR